MHKLITDSTMLIELTPAEQRKLRRVCRYCNLPFEAQAVRTHVARRLIADYYDLTHVYTVDEFRKVA